MPTPPLDSSGEVNTLIQTSRRLRVYASTKRAGTRRRLRNLLIDLERWSRRYENATQSALPVAKRTMQVLLRDYEMDPPRLPLRKNIELEVEDDRGVSSP
jgi:hypothetical protein